MKNIFFLTPGKAIYPEIEAYKSFFNKKFNVFDGELADYQEFSDKSNTILWCIMGFYPKKPKALYIIHDYRSLSIGKLFRIKDHCKVKFNHTPDFRIFLNHAVKEKLPFKDKKPHCLLDMGVPDWIFNIQPHPLIKGDYCYIGEISFTRQIHRLIDAFLAYRSNQVFILVGRVDTKILSRYKHHKNLIFTQQLSQKEALSIVKACKSAICYIPNTPPYCYQTPTKLLEYAALNMSILANDCLSNITIAKAIQVNITITDGNIFDSKRIKYNSIPSTKKKRTLLTWHEIIRNSGIENHIISST